MTTPTKPKPCKVCYGRGYTRCDCWPGDCICGWDDEPCEACFATGIEGGGDYDDYTDFMEEPKMTDHGKLERLRARYDAAAHRVQTCIAAMPGHANMQPKHMRVGIDMSKSDQGGLASLLIAKGVFTLEEYVEAIATQAEAEAEAYETEASVRFGINVKSF